MRKRKPGQKSSRSRRQKAGVEGRQRRFEAAAGKFPIVALGASAGGLEALEEFFSHARPDAGMAFVVVTHQHPGHVSLLPELLGKHTRMPVIKARDGQQLRPNHVYLSRAEQYLGILNGVLQLVKFKKEPDGRLPIDHFFCSLAGRPGQPRHRGRSLGNGDRRKAWV